METNETEFKAGKSSVLENQKLHAQQEIDIEGGRGNVITSRRAVSESAPLAFWKEVIGHNVDDAQDVRSGRADGGE